MQTIRFGYTDKRGNWVIEPKFEQAFNFSKDDSSAVVRVGNKWHFIDKNGNYISPYAFDEIACNFYKDVAVVKKNGTWGLLKRTENKEYCFITR